MLGNLYPNLDTETNKKENKKTGKRDSNFFSPQRLIPVSGGDNEVDSQRSLINNPINDSRITNYQEEPVHREDSSEDQMDFGLQTQRIYSIDRVKQQLNRWEDIIEVLPYWKLAINPVNLTIAVATSLIISIAIYSQSFSISENAILFYSQIDDFHLTIPKILFLIFPILIIVFEIILLRLERFVFNFDQRLSTVISSSQIFINILSIISIIQLLSLMLS